MNKKKKDELDITKLSNSQENLESILENAFCEASRRAEDNDGIDVKTLKDLTSTLKEAVNIKRNIFLLPVLAEQKERERMLRENPPAPTAQTSEICIILENDAEKYSV